MSKHLRSNRADEGGVRQFEAALDQYPLQMSICQEPLGYATWDLCLVHEWASYTNPLRAIDDAKYALMYSLRWMHQSTTKPSSFRPPKVINPRRFKNATELFLCGLEYKTVVTAFTYYSRGAAQAFLVDHNSISFEADREELRYDALDWIITARMIQKAEITTNAISKDTTFQQLVAGVIQPVTRMGGIAGSIKRLPQGLLELAAAHSEYDRSPYLLPDTWSFRGISVKTFRMVWDLVKAISDAHVAFCGQKYGPLGAGDNLAVLPITVQREDWLTALKSLLPTVSSEEIKSICGLFEYTLPAGNADPALQPFIPTGDGYICLPPTLFLSCRHERNLVALLAKRYPKEYSTTTGILEAELLSELARQCTANGWAVTVKVSVAQRRDLPDIDIAVYDRKSSYLLLIEAKWVIAPAEAAERFARAERESEGIGQIRELLDFAKSNLPDLWRSCLPNANVPQGLALRGCVVIRGFTGTAKNHDDEIPVIEASLILERLQSCRDLGELANWLLSSAYLPSFGKEMEYRQVKASIGPYTVLWDGYRLLRSAKALDSGPLGGWFSGGQ